MIEDYHKTLGYHLRAKTPMDNMEHIRHMGLALVMEMAELVDSFPWKPWRNMVDQVYDKENATEEIVDCLFGLGFIMEAADITPEDIKVMFDTKLRENYDRIKRGYNNDPEERG